MSFFNFEVVFFVFFFVGEVGKRKRLDNYRVDLDLISKVYGFGYLIKFLMSGIYFYFILFFLVFGLGVVK